MAGRRILSRVPSGGWGAEMTGGVESQPRPITVTTRKGVSFWPPLLSWVAMVLLPGRMVTVRSSTAVWFLKSVSTRTFVPFRVMTAELRLESLLEPFCTLSSA